MGKAEELMMANKRQEQTIGKFRNGALNVLVSTSVLEEGIDVKSCNCVIRAFPPDDFRAYIQSRGRARAQNAIYCLLCPEDQSNALNLNLQQFNAIEQLLTSRFTTSNYAIDTTISLPDAFPPYVVESTGARVTLSNAIALVNRYCAKLPSDVFTRLVPEVNDIQIDQGNGQVLYKAELLLPINAPIKEPIRLENPVYSRSLARMAVALKACEVLHSRKELTDNLLPAGKDSIAQDFLSEVVEDDEYMTGVAGRNIKKRRLYDRKVTKTLTKALAKVGQECNLYIIDIQLVAPLSEEDNLKKRRIIDPHSDVTAFGFICTSELPAITHFPVFLRQGKTEVSFVRAATKQIVDMDTMELIYEFHSHIFEDILRVAKNAVAFSPENAYIPLLIVPLIKKLDSNGCVFDAELDRSRLLPNIRQIEPIPSLEARQNYKFDEKRFKDAVVLPWYRVSDHPTYYYVAEICHNDHPNSKFPDEKYISFNDYFINKYNLTIYDQQQPLLDVDRASERMNLILPRAPSSRAKKQSFDPTQRQILVPELVHCHPLSATYWTMIIALPTILYRLNQFLLIDELRSIIVQDAFKANPITPPNHEWPKLDYDTPNVNSNEKSIRNISQLRQSQPIEPEPESIRSNDIFSDDVMNVDGNHHTFDVGYWDPNEAAAFQTLRTDPFDLANSIPEKISEQSALGRTTDDMDISDTEIEEYEIITDYTDLRRTIGGKI
jgi:endoribonuclease Dicer